MIAYKVVRVKDKPRWWEFWKQPKYVSAVVKGYAQVEYKVGEWADPPPWLAFRGYYLTAFPDKETAVRFRSYSCQIWAAEVQNAKWGKALPLPTADMNGLNSGLVALAAQPTVWPPRTIMAERIKLLKRLR